MRVVGLTGGVAAGKSTVAGHFRALGIEVVDADRIAREVVEPGSAGLAAVVGAFGPEVLTAEGALDRQAMRRRVFTDPAARRRLEAITHPRIRARLIERLAAARGPYVVADIPLLAESPALRALVDRVLVVDVPELVQLQRLMARDGINRTTAQTMLDAQSPRAARLAIADDVLDNSGAPGALAETVAGLHKRYLALASQRRPR